MQVFLKTAEGTPLTVYVNPHTAAIVGAQRSDRTQMQLAQNIHGTLLIGTPGAVLMELTAFSAFVLIGLGLFLWWPRDRKGGVFWPRFHLKGRAWWREVHAVPGFYVSVLVLLFLTTGLPWTGITGKIIDQISVATGTGSPPGFGPSPFKSSAHADRAAPIALDRLVEIARERLPGVPAAIALPRDHSSAAVIRWKAPQPQDRAYIHVDMYSGRVLADYRWKDFGWIGKFVLMAVALHEGTWFGVKNQILNSVVALGVLLLAISGIAMWWKGRPKSM
jgi:uncharacterized iron-regulated membrane protein